MANWQYQPVFENARAGFSIRRCVSRYGDSHSGRTFSDKPVGIHFLTQGSVYVLNADGEKTGQFSPGERIVQANLDDYAKGSTILVSKELTEYFCICDPGYKTPWDGQVLALKKGRKKTLKNIAGRYVFVAAGAVIVGDRSLPAGTVAVVSETQSPSFLASADAILCVFYRL